MIFKELSDSDAQELIKVWHEGDMDSVKEYEHQVGKGDSLDPILSEASNAIVHLKHASSSSSNRVDPASFDSKAAVAFHSTIRARCNLPPDIEGRRRFWIWLALAKMYDVIEWRHHRDGGAHPANYGLGSRERNYAWLLWFRAELSYDEKAADPYELTRRGSIDFWESGILRPRYSACRPLVRAFIRYQYPAELSGKPRLHPTNPNGARQLYKILRRRHATMALELLDDSDAYSLIDNLGAGLQRA